LNAGLEKQLKSLGWDVKFSKNIQTKQTTKKRDAQGIIKNPSYVGNVCEQVKNEVEKAAKDGQLALTIGGDHSLAIGSIFGSLLGWKGTKEVCVVWVDAHADINTPETTPSGNIHGMPLSWILGLSETKVAGFEWCDGLQKLACDRLVYIGLRDVDDGEKQLLKQHKIKVNAHILVLILRVGILYA
jgi:arginase